MTDPGDGALHYIREEFTRLRAAFDALATEVRAQSPRLAVLERRADDHGTYLTDVRATTDSNTGRVTTLENRAAAYDRDIADLREQLRTTARNRIAWLLATTSGSVVAVVAAILAWLTR